MASQIPFNNATVASTPIATSEMVHGSCRYNKAGQDTATTTADGRIHNDRIAINKEISFTCYGDKTALESAVGLGVTVVLKYDANTVDTVTGIVAASYDSNNKTTSITISVDPS